MTPSQSDSPDTRPADAPTPVSYADLASWIGRSETLHDTITSTPVIALAATLDHPAAPVLPGDTLPLLWHWLYFLPMRPTSPASKAIPV